MVTVLHDLHQACRYADHLIAMRDGEIIASGPPATIVSPELVRAVLNIECDVLADPQTHRPLVSPVRARSWRFHRHAARSSIRRNHGTRGCTTLDRDSRGAGA